MAPPRGLPVPWIVFIVLLVIVLIGVAVAFATFPSTTPSVSQSTSVDVTQVIAYSPDNACGLNGADEGGFAASGVSFQPLAWFLPASASVSVPCTVSTITTPTAGFTVEAGNLPFTATSPMTFMSITVVTPSSYAGTLNITFT